MLVQKPGDRRRQRVCRASIYEHQGIGELVPGKQEGNHRRYRHAALSCRRTLLRVVETFERVQRGQLALDPTIDVVTTLNLKRDQILARLKARFGAPSGPSV